MELHVMLLAFAAAAAAGFASLAVARRLLAHDLAVGERLAGLTSVTETNASRMNTDRRASLHSLVPRFPGARPQLDRAGVRMTSAQFALARLALIAVMATAGAVAADTMQIAPPAGILAGAVVGYLAPVVVLRWRTARRGRRVEGQLVELCEVMASMLTAGFGYMQALREAATQVGGPLGEEVTRFLDAVSLGADFEVALGEVRERLQSDDFEVVATALEVQRRTGGNLAEILDGVAITIRDRQTFQRELRALTSRERFSAVIVAAFPLGLVSVLTLIMPEVFGRLFTDSVGQIVLGIALGLDALGYVVARRLATLEV
ncbi:MAG: type II secretion system F family protein [Dehalococcoidia bacterium]|nr:type II secretion system F family protein [Dehalococcoidia bacterium]